MLDRIGEIDRGRLAEREDGPAIELQLLVAVGQLGGSDLGGIEAAAYEGERIDGFADLCAGRDLADIEAEQRGTVVQRYEG